MDIKKYFTIRGYQKSGTNWLSNLVNRHPQIYCRGEYHFKILKRAVNNYLENDFRAKFQKEVKANYRVTVEECLVKGVSNPGQILWFGDRTPTDLFPKILPNIKQLFIVRDGRDVFVSQIYHRLRHGFNGAHLRDSEFNRVFSNFPSLESKLELFKKDTSYFDKNPMELITDKKYVEHFAKHWDNFIQDNLKFIFKLEKIKKEENVLIVKYEDLHDNMEDEMVRIINYFNLDSESLNPLDEKTSPGFKKVDNLSLYRSGKVRGWEKHFNQDMLDCYNISAERSLKYFDYL